LISLYAASGQPFSGQILVTAPPGLRLKFWDAGRREVRFAPKLAYRGGRYRIPLDRLAGPWMQLSK
jgi:hypothetical protein